LQRNPNKRLGAGHLDADELKTHPFFCDVDFNKILYKKFKPPVLATEEKLEKGGLIFDQDYIVNKDLSDDMRKRKKSQGNEIEGWTFIGKNAKQPYNKINK